MSCTLDSLKEEILAELEAQLCDDVGYKEEVVESKLNIAFQEVLQARTMKHGGKYPASWSEEKTYADLRQFSSHIFNLALFDYNTIGIEFQTSSTENSTTRTYRDRDRLFNGIVPLSRLV
ncbi:MAG: hypothetical protein IKO36_08270 [Bacteroidaceae bacterium]|nr:hypothetical protein [Bacteroidaceae bacterium]